MTHAIRLLTTLGIIAATVSAAGAQERLEVVTAVGAVSRIVEFDATVSGFGAVRSLDAPNLTTPPNGLVALAGGRYVVWLEGGGVGVLDRRTRAVARAALPGVAGTPIEIVADPHRPRLFVSAVVSQTPLELRFWVLDAPTMVTRLLHSATDLVQGLAYAPLVDELFVTQASRDFPYVHFTDVIDVERATVRRRLARSGWLDDVQVSDDGRVMWGIDSVFRLGRLYVVDGQTGATLAQGPVIRSSFAVDGPRRRLLLHDDEFVVALDALTLSEIWRRRIDLPLSLRGHHAENQVLPGRWMTGAYVLHVENRFDGVCQGLEIVAIDPEGGGRRASQLLPLAGATGSRCTAAAVLVRSPFAPGALSAAVSGNTVSLSWQNPGDTTEFELEYGFGPGQRAGALAVGQTTKLSLPGVPKGTYYLRVVARNEVGRSPGSNEVRVTVQ